VGPRAGLDAEARRKILCLFRGSNLGRPVRSQTLYCLNYPSSPIFTFNKIYLFVVYLTTLSIAQTVWCRMIGFEFERIWKEGVVTKFKVPGGTAENKEKCQSSVRDLNLGPPEYKTGVLTTRQPVNK
jgi:hypothetical protein